MFYKVPPLGGLKQDLPSHLLDRHFSPSLNGMWPIKGKIRRIPGKNRLVDTALDASGGVMGIYQWNLDNGTSYLVAVTQDKTYYFNAGAFTEIQPTAGDFTGGNADLFDMIPFFDSAGADILVITNGVDNIKKWTGTGDIADLGGSPAKCKYLEVYKNYLFKANITGTDTRQLQYSALGNGESHPVANYINLYVSSDAIVRPKILRDSLVVYKERSISVIDYTGDALVFRLRENLINGLGLIGSRAVQTSPFGTEVHYFIGSDLEMYAFDLIERNPIGPSISPVLAQLDPATWNSIVSVKSDEYDKLIWALPGRGQTGNFDLLILDIKTGSWWVHEGEANRIFSMAEGKQTSSLTWDTLPFSTWDSFDLPEGWDALGTSGQNTQLILFGCADGRVRHWVAGEDDDGTALDSHYTYPFDNLDGEERTEKLLNKVVLEVANEGTGEITLQIFKDSNDTQPAVLDEDGNTSKTISLVAADSSKTWIRYEIDVAVAGYNFSFKLASTGATWSGRLIDLDWEVLGTRVV